MPKSFTNVFDNSQNGYAGADNLYHGAGVNANLSMAVGQTMVFRFPHYIPPGATITAATLRLPFATKLGDTSGTSSHTLSTHSSGNSPEFTENASIAASSRPRIATTINFTANYTANQGAAVASVNVLSQVQAINALGNFVAGGYITFFVACTAETGDMNFSVDGSLGERPSLDIDYTISSQPLEFWDFNVLQNPSFATDTEYWGSGTFYGAHAEGTVARDTSFTYAGRPTLKFTAPALQSGVTSTGPSTGALISAGQNYIFCGMVYIPSSVTQQVICQFVFENVWTEITTRNAWVPFCTNPLAGTSRSVFPSVTISNYAAGQNLWLADCAVYASNFRQAPFSYASSKGTTFGHSARWKAGRGTVVRRNTPKKYYHDGTTTRPRRSYILRDDGIWVPTQTN